MAITHYPDAGHSEHPPGDYSDSIELSRLQELTITPSIPHQKHEGFDHNDTASEEDDEDDSIDEDEGDRALLAPRERSPPSRYESEAPTVWTQARGIVVETGPTLVLTTIGLLFTGELLNHVSRWKAMSQIDELIIIIPVVLNLKGNLEMNLSARLSTAANVGELDTQKARRDIILGNLTLLQVQATVVSLVAAVVAFVLGRVLPKPAPTDPEAEIIGISLFTRLHRRRPRPSQLPKNVPGGLNEFLLTASSAMLSACLSSVILGSFMSGLILVCRKFGMDPDNIAPPVAACLGDLVTLLLLGAISTVMILLMNTPIPLITIIILIVAAVAWAFVTRANLRVGHLLKEGWFPLFAAMAVSCGAGIVLDLFVSRFEGFALLATVISGLPGNVGAILVSRLSTALHTTSLKLGVLPSASTEAFGAPRPPKPVASPKVVIITLCLITLPIEIAFLAVLRGVGWLRLPFVFLAFSLLFFCIAVVVSLYLAQILTNFLWKRNLDPDMYALPIHSAIIDLVGQLLLVVCFEILSALGVPLGRRPDK